MIVAYDGTDFRGFASNPGVRTVGGVLSAAIERVLGDPVDITCAGRTDKGVHARGQVVSFDADRERFDPEGLQRALNRLCAPEIAVRQVVAVPDGFDARRSAQSRLYRYAILNQAAPDPFLARTAWHVGSSLDLAALRQGSYPLIGEHDFASFCRRPKPAGKVRGAHPGVDDSGAAHEVLQPSASLVRRVIDASWSAHGSLLEFDIRANSFCQQMVRSIVGTLVEVGTGKRSAAEVSAILRSGDRQSVTLIAPPHGLCLMSVEYPHRFAAEVSPEQH